MEIEAKPKIHTAYVQNMVSYVISAHTAGKMTDEQWKQFIENVKTAFLDDVQRIAEIAFDKGRDYERRNPKDKP